MNASEAITKIADLLGLKFKSENFTVTKLVDEKTTVTNNLDKPFTVGDTLFVVGEDSILKPAPAGEHTTREGLCLYVGEDSVITKIELEEAKETEKEAVVEIEVETKDDTMEKVEMTKAKLSDGTEIETNDSGEFAVGQKLFVITESGEKTKAPEGEHTTESGIVLTVDGEGTITGVKYPDKEGEGSMKDYESDIKKMKEAMEEMFSMLKTFSKDFESYKKDYEEFKKSPVHEKPVLRKTFGQENIMDAKVEFLKNALRK